MIYDIAMCKREDCPKRKTCYRYQAWLEIKGKDCCVSMMRPDKSPCEHYMNIKRERMNR